ncbi:hypothetical protein DTO282F9_6711 [Paecilomyces variotii]|nr:hypothetical protein DTO282F9_6711 [Paecilomyces variotii]
MSTIVGIAGITGKSARCIVGELLKQQHVFIRGFCRDPAKLPDSIKTSPRVHITQGGSDDMKALRSFARSCSVVICCYLGDNKLMTDGQKILIDACELEGVQRYIASDYTVDFTKLQYGQLPSKDPMILVKEYLESKDVAGVHVLIGAFMDTFWYHWFGIWDPAQYTLSYWGTGTEVWESTSYANAAEFVSAVALDETAVGLQKFLGDRKSIVEIADTFESVYGKRPGLNRLGSSEDLYKLMHQKMAEDPANVLSYLNLFYQYYCTNGQTYLDIDMENRRYPHVKRVTFEDFMRSHSVDELSTAMEKVGMGI